MERINRLKILPTGDKQSELLRRSPEEILAIHGPPRTLLSGSAKAQKSLGVGVLNKVMFLTSGVFCPRATPGCLKSCLGHSSGRMSMAQSTLARDKRSALYLTNSSAFVEKLIGELSGVLLEAKFKGLTPAVRLNGTSDIPWEQFHPEIFKEFPSIRFFDYTKIPSRMRRFLDSVNWPKNYHLTFSMGESNELEAKEILELGGNVATVFWPQLPATWNSHSVLDGDKHDARFLGPAPVVVGLLAKGKAQNDTSGFVIQNEQPRKFVTAFV